MKTRGESIEVTDTTTASKPILLTGIGPFTFDYKKKIIILAPGTYEVTEPITFGLSNKTRIVGCKYKAKTAVRKVGRA